MYIIGIYLQSEEGKEAKKIKDEIEQENIYLIGDSAFVCLILPKQSWFGKKIVKTLGCSFVDAWQGSCKVYHSIRR